MGDIIKENKLNVKIITTDEFDYKRVENSLLNKNILTLDYFLNPIQYDGRIRRILNYFYLNNEPLFYLAL